MSISKDMNHPEPKMEITSKIEIKEESETSDEIKKEDEKSDFQMSELLMSEPIEIKVEPLWETAGLCELSDVEDNDDDDENSFSDSQTFDEQACFGSNVASNGNDRMISFVPSCAKYGEEKKYLVTIKMENKPTYNKSWCESTSSLPEKKSSGESCASNGSYNCSECKMSFNQKTDLHLHNIQVHNKFSVVDSNFFFKDSISTDIKTLMPAQTTLGTVFVIKCSLCNQEFKRNSNLVRHIQTFHKKIKTYTCFVCKKEFSRKGDVARHILTIHEKLTPFKCQMCDYGTSTKNHLNRHIKRTHENVREFKCSKCNKEFSSKGDLSRHILLVHEKMKEFKCSVCEKDFCTKSHILRHIKTIHNQTVEGNCSSNSSDNVSGSSQINLESEMKCQFGCISCATECHLASPFPTILDNLNSFKCSVCGKDFQRKKYLTKHVQNVHIKNKVHKCSTCGNGFCWQSDLNRHNRTVHENIRPFKCSLCDKHFGKNSHLTRHLKTVHKEIKIEEHLNQV